MLAAWRGCSRLLEGHAAIVREGRWRPAEKRITPSLAGKHLCIVGLGAIGEAARRAEDLRFEDRLVGAEREAGRPLAARRQYLAAHRRGQRYPGGAPRGPRKSNRGLIDRAVIDALGPSGLLINVARGQLVDEEALIAALNDERLGMAALDVFAAEPTPAERNVVLSPHTGGATSAALPKMVALTRENLRRFFAGEPLANAVVE